MHPLPYRPTREHNSALLTHIPETAQLLVISAHHTTD